MNDEQAQHVVRMKCNECGHVFIAKMPKAVPLDLYGTGIRHECFAIGYNNAIEDCRDAILSAMKGGGE